MSPFGFCALGWNLIAKNYHTVEIVVTKKQRISVSYHVYSRLVSLLFTWLLFIPRRLVVPVCHSRFDDDRSFILMLRNGKKRHPKH